MSTKKTDEVVDYDELRRMGYDRRDVSLKSFNKMIIWYYVVTTAFVIISYVVYIGLNNMFGSQDPPKPLTTKRMGPDVPVLQSNVTTVTDMRDLRLSEEAALAGYQWVDQPSGTVRIPISDAMKKLAQSGAFGPQTPRSEPPPVASEPAGGMRPVPMTPIPVPDEGGQ